MSVTPNLVLTARPDPRDGDIILAPPLWLRIGFRALLLLGGLALLALAFWSRSTLTLPWAIFTTLIAALTIASALWSKPWSRFDLFIASTDGIAFPANDMLVARVGHSGDPRWLLVPWANVLNIRTARVRGDRTSCVAFDLRVSYEERDAFFSRVDSPADRTGERKDVVHAAFDINPPRPDKTVARLLQLANRSKVQPPR